MSRISVDINGLNSETSLVLMAKRRILIKMMFLFIQNDQDFYPGRRKRGKDYEDGMVNISTPGFYYYLTSLLGNEMFEVDLSVFLCSMSFPFTIQGW